MDRDNRWERVETAYDAMIKGQGNSADTPSAAVKAAYESDKTDEFIPATVIGDYAGLAKGDGFFSLNWLFYPILMVVRGGTGTIFGPWIGAFFVGALFAYGDIYFGGYHPVFSGVLIILVMLFMPGGIVGLGEKLTFKQLSRFTVRRTE